MYGTTICSSRCLPEIALRHMQICDSNCKAHCILWLIHHNAWVPFIFYGKWMGVVSTYAGRQSILTVCQKVEFGQTLYKWINPVWRVLHNIDFVLSCHYIHWTKQVKSAHLKRNSIFWHIGWLARKLEYCSN